MKILGIDPGTIRLGYCVLELEYSKISLVDAGFLKIDTKILQHQITELAEGIDQVLKDHKIDAVAIEDIFFAHNPKTVLKLAQFRGALALKILLEVGNFAEYTPLQVKKAVTGKAKATKEQVAFMMKTLLGIKGDIKPLDITDAMAIAYVHAMMLKMQKV